MPKSWIRASRASGSDKRKVEKLIRRGWQPGVAIGQILESPKRKGQVPVRGGQYCEQ